ncbi:MAG TPA: ATP-binding protein [Dehalococcoidia bacterium]|nr:ATP-binding protein [Dehalococcoidia bacterium]
MDTWSSAELPEEEPPPCPICKGAGFVHPQLPTGQMDYSRVVPCHCTQKELEESRLARLQRYSNLGSLTRLTFDNLIPQGRSGDPQNQERFLRAYQAAKSFAQNPQGWLVFMGPSGCGKTHLAVAIANYRLQQNQLAFFQPVPDLLDHLRSTFSPSSDISYDELFEQMKNVPLLTLDDLGRQSSTPWAEEKLFQLINHRFNAQLPTVINISAGVSLEKIEGRWGTRLTDPSLSQLYLLEEKRPAILDYMGDLGQELYRQMTFDKFDYKRVNLPLDKRRNLEDAFRRALSFAESPQGWLVFLGTNGCGKTHLAAAIANYRFQRGEQVYFTFIPDLLDHLRSTFSPESKVSYDEIFERVKKAPLLILDDFGEHSSTPWAQEKLYQLINHRYTDRLPTVITITGSQEGLEERVEIRICSRMIDQQISTVFEILAPDYRGDRQVIERPKPRRSQRG